MNELPPLLPRPELNPGSATTGHPDPRALGDDPRDREPIHGPFAAIDSILRHPRRLVYWMRQTGSGGLMAVLILIAVFCSLVYGFVVGTFSGQTQLWAAPLKIAGGLMMSAIIC